jgi:hypothetical protein
MCDEVGRRRLLGTLILQVFRGLLIAIVVADLILAGFVGWYISQLDNRIDADWEKFASYRNTSEYHAITSKHELTRNMTKDSFVQLVHGGYKFLAIAALVVLLVLVGAVVAASFVIKTSAATPGGGDSILGLGILAKLLPIKKLIPGGGDDSSSDDDDGPPGGGCLACMSQTALLCCCCRSSGPPSTKSLEKRDKAEAKKVCVCARSHPSAPPSLSHSHTWAPPV